MKGSEDEGEICSSSLKPYYYPPSRGSVSFLSSKTITSGYSSSRSSVVSKHQHHQGEDSDDCEDSPIGADSLVLSKEPELHQIDEQSKGGPLKKRNHIRQFYRRTARDTNRGQKKEEDEGEKEEDEELEEEEDLRWETRGDGYHHNSYREKTFAVNGQRKRDETTASRAKQLVAERPQPSSWSAQSTVRAQRSLLDNETDSNVTTISDQLLELMSKRRRRNLSETAPTVGSLFPLDSSSLRLLARYRCEPEAMKSGAKCSKGIYQIAFDSMESESHLEIDGSSRSSGKAHVLFAEARKEGQTFEQEEEEEDEALFASSLQLVLPGISRGEINEEDNADLSGQILEHLVSASRWDTTVTEQEQDRSDCRAPRRRGPTQMVRSQQSLAQEMSEASQLSQKPWTKFEGASKRTKGASSDLDGEPNEASQREKREKNQEDVEEVVASSVQEPVEAETSDDLLSGLGEDGLRKSPGNVLNEDKSSPAERPSESGHQVRRQVAAASNLRSSATARSPFSQFYISGIFPQRTPRRMDCLCCCVM